MDLTVVICTHNRSFLLARLLDSLVEAERPESFSFEILVIANACSDETTQMLEQSKAHLARFGLQLLWEEEATPGKSRALNHALGIVRGQAIMFVDDDQRVDRTFIRAISQTLTTYPLVNLFCGRLMPDWDGTEPTWVHEQGRYRIYPPPITTFDAGNEPRDISAAAFKPPGGNLLVRKQLLKRLGTFSINFGPQGHDLGSGEDSEYLQRALDAGEPLYYAPDILQFHQVDPARLRLTSIMRLSYERSRASARIHGPHGKIPLYLWKKLGGYLTLAVFSLSAQRIRFHLTRCAAVLGEIKGLSEADSSADD